MGWGIICVFARFELKNQECNGRYKALPFEFAEN
jgi:hypothetical protein